MSLSLPALAQGLRLEPGPPQVGGCHGASAWFCREDQLLRQLCDPRNVKNHREEFHLSGPRRVTCSPHAWVELGPLLQGTWGARPCSGSWERHGCEAWEHGVPCAAVFSVKAALPPILTDLPPEGSRPSVILGLIPSPIRGWRLTFRDYLARRPAGGIAPAPRPAASGGGGDQDPSSQLPLPSHRAD